MGSTGNSDSMGNVFGKGCAETEPVARRKHVGLDLPWESTPYTQHETTWDRDEAPKHLPNCDLPVKEMNDRDDFHISTEVSRMRVLFAGNRFRLHLESFGLIMKRVTDDQVYQKHVRRSDILHCGISCRRCGLFRLAYDFYDAAIRGSPGKKFSLARYNRALLTRALGDLNGSLRDFELAIEARKAERGIYGDPGYYLARMNLGSTKLMLGREREAVDDLLESIRLCGADPFPAAHYELGRAYLRLRRYDDSTKHFSVAAKQYRTTSQSSLLCCSRAYAAKGYVNLLCQKYEDAQSALTHAIETCDRFWYARNLRAFLYCCQREYTKAMKDFEAVLEINSRDPAAVKGSVFARDGNYLSVIEFMRENYGIHYELMTSTSVVEACCVDVEDDMDSETGGVHRRLIPESDG